MKNAGHGLGSEPGLSTETFAKLHRNANALTPPQSVHLEPRWVKMGTFLHRSVFEKAPHKTVG